MRSCGRMTDRTICSPRRLSPDQPLVHPINRSQIISSLTRSPHHEITTFSYVTSCRSHWRRARRICRGFLCRRPWPEGHPDRQREESRRRLPLPRLHSVEGVAARRQGPRRIEARQGVGHRVRRAQDRRHQAPRLQEPRRREADQRHRAGVEVPQGQLHPGLGVDRRSEDHQGEEERRRRGNGQRRLHDPRARIAADEDPGAVQRLAARARFHGRARPAGSAEVDAGDRRRLHRPRARLGLRRAGHEGVGGRNDAGPAARAPIAIW